MANFKVVTQKPAGVTFDLADGQYTLERESLDPIGAEIITIDASTEEEFIAQAKDADAIIARGRKITKKNRFYVQAGAGIVADSKPINEYNETINKAKALLKSLE